MISQDDVHHLVPWSEVVGVLTELHDHEDVLLAQVGSITLRLPTDMASALRPHLGENIGVLRTDLASKLYVLRVLKNGESGEIKSSVGDRTPTEVKAAACKSQDGTSDYDGLLSCSENQS